MTEKQKPKFKVGDVLRVMWSGDNGPIQGIIQITGIDNIRDCYEFNHLDLHYRRFDVRGYSVIEDLVKGEKLKNGALFYGK